MEQANGTGHGRTDENGKRGESRLKLPAGTLANSSLTSNAQHGILSTPVSVLIARAARRLPASLYVHNPFYLLSACFVFYGLYLLFNGSTASASGWWLLGLMLTYTAIMATAAIMVVKLGKVWEDARSILLIVAMLFLATSVSLDEMGIRLTRTLALPLLLSGLIGAILISQFLLRLLRIRLGLLYSLAYHTILSIFFLYPLGVMYLQEFGNPSNLAHLGFALAGFPVAQGLAFLTLLPAIRRGAGLVRNNGTPWTWPRFPLALFGLLAFGVCARQYFLTISFLPLDGMASPFGLYSLLPFFLVIALLAVELGMVTENRRIQTAGLLLPLMAILCSFSPADRSGVYADMLAIIQRNIASPVLIAVVAAGLFYVYTWWRGIKGSGTAFAVTLAIGSMASTRTLDWGDLVRPNAWALAAIAVFALAAAFRRRSSVQYLVGLALLIGALVSFGAERIAASVLAGGAFHVALFGLLGLGAFFHDGIARKAQDFCGTVWVPVVVLVPIFAHEALSRAFWPSAVAYVLVMTATAFAYWRFTGNEAFRKAWVLSLATAVIYGAFGAYEFARRIKMTRAAAALIGGSVFFAIAFLISLFKGGVLKKRRERGALAQLSRGTRHV